jgi:hypothetical protein
MKEALDTRANGIFGLCVAIWATIFLESWKRKEKTISYIWACQDNSYSKADERSDTFEYYDTYNPNSKTIDKDKKNPTRSSFWFRNFLSLNFLVIVLVAMVYYQSAAQQFKGVYDEKGNLVVKPTF